MIEALDRAKKELNRADHLYHVSLKYTRTVDVLKSLIERLLNVIDSANEALLRKAKEEDKLDEIPKIPRLRLEEIKKIYPEDETIKNYSDFFLILRKISKAEFTRAQEFRRHVTMTAKVNDKSIEVTIDIIGDYYKRTQEYVQYVSELIEGKKE